MARLGARCRRKFPLVGMGFFGSVTNYLALIVKTAVKRVGTQETALPV